MLGDVFENVVEEEPECHNSARKEYNRKDFTHGAQFQEAEDIKADERKAHAGNDVDGRGAEYLQSHAENVARQVVAVFEHAFCQNFADVKVVKACHGQHHAEQYDEKHHGDYDSVPFGNFGKNHNFPQKSF